MFWGGLNGDGFYPDADDMDRANGDRRFHPRSETQYIPLARLNLTVEQRCTEKSILVRHKENKLTFWLPKKAIGYKNGEHSLADWALGIFHQNLTNAAKSRERWLRANRRNTDKSA